MCCLCQMLCVTARKDLSGASYEKFLMNGSIFQNLFTLYIPLILSKVGI